MKRACASLLAAAAAIVIATGCSKNGSGQSPSTGETIVLKVLAGQSTTDAGIEKMIDEALAAGPM